MEHKVCVLSCPHCKHEKVVSDSRKYFKEGYTCKNCKETSKAHMYKVCYSFEGVSDERIQYAIN